MSERNVEALRRAVDARNRGDTAGLLAEIDPEVEWYPGLAAQLKGSAMVLRGHDGVREWVRDLDDVFTRVTLELEVVRDLGDRVIAFGEVRGRGATSGAEIEWPIAYVVEFKNARLAVVRTYLDQDQAREAAGLLE